ncbi:MAG: FAD:protein FMN transferase [Thermoleophilaceae bacterium]|nr:FAD:protein FMN transferase [Thermoleophilaceae bacterium]
MTEAAVDFECFGGRCTIRAAGPGAAAATGAARATLLAWHARFSRFLAASELSRLNADTRTVVPVSPMLARLAAAVGWAGGLTGGLVDGTLLSEIEAAGYVPDAPPSRPLADALAHAPARVPAGPSPLGRWRELTAGADWVRRPPGLMLDSGGLAKGLFADVLAERLRGRPGFAVVCGGDLRVGGAARAVEVESPFDGTVLLRFEVAEGGVATSGIGRRSWEGRDGRPAHHLLDPATGRPAFTGVVQATAIAPTALEAEVRAKAALLSGPERAASWLPYGGALVLDDGTPEVLEAAARLPVMLPGLGVDGLCAGAIAPCANRCQ